MLLVYILMGLAVACSIVILIHMIFRVYKLEVKGMGLTLLEREHVNYKPTGLKQYMESQTQPMNLSHVHWTAMLNEQFSIECEMTGVKSKVNEC